MTKYLIVNADDFGLSPGVNRGIIEVAERGILTSASLMVRQSAAASAAAYAQKNPKLDIGIHIDLGEWVYRNGEWVALYSVVATTDFEAVSDEVRRQFAQFEKLMDRPPTHVDSHQHVHRDDPARTIVQDLAGKLGVPVRDQTPGVTYCGDFYGQTAEGQSVAGSLSISALKTILAALPEGVTELGCHPGYDDGLATAYRVERAIEVQTLCAPEFRAMLAELGIQLYSFSSLKAGRSLASPESQTVGGV
jgi:predicted glycoside hydrolase/deacetylase ChbG (UPF0249 family)